MLAIDNIVLLLFRLRAQQIINSLSEFSHYSDKLQLINSEYLYNNVQIATMLALDSKFLCSFCQRCKHGPTLVALNA